MSGWSIETSSGAARPKLLMVTHRVPYPPDKGDRIRTWHMLHHLSRRYDVYLASLVDEPIRLATWRALREVTADMALVPMSEGVRHVRAIRSLAAGGSLTEGMFQAPWLSEQIRRWVDQHTFDAALGVCSSTAAYLRDVPAARKVIDLIDVDSAKWADYALTCHGVQRWMYRMEAGRLARCERQLADQMDAVMVVSAPEAAAYRALAPSCNIVTVTNGVDLDYFSPQQEAAERPVVVFTGVLDYRPNVLGLRWLARHVWPHVRRAVPDAELRIVGRNPTRAVRRLSRIDGVDVRGPVPDVRPHLAEAAAAVAPLTIGRGIQNKVLEAMAMGRAVVASPQAAEGIGARDDEHLLIARTAGQWIVNLCTLLVEPLLGRSIGHAARQYVQIHHRWDQCLSPLLDLLTADRTTSTTSADTTRSARRAA